MSAFSLRHLSDIKHCDVVSSSLDKYKVSNCEILSSFMGSFAMAFFSKWYRTRFCRYFSLFGRTWRVEKFLMSAWNWCWMNCVWVEGRKMILGTRQKSCHSLGSSICFSNGARVKKVSVKNNERMKYC